MSDLQQQIHQRAKFRAEEDLLRQLGYAKPGRHHRERLAMVLADPALGLGTPMYDFVHGRRDFLRALCSALRIPKHSCREFIAERDAYEKAERQAYKPWLFVDTGFRRSARPGMPLFALALLERRRRLKLPADTSRLPWDEQLVRAQVRVREHMAESGGELKVWVVSSATYFVTLRVTSWRLHRVASCWGMPRARDCLWPVSPSRASQSYC